jgi:hypothetical protein
VCALSVGGAALAGGTLPRWAGWLSVLVGLVCVVSAGGPSLLAIGTLLFLAWLVVLGVVLIRGPARVRPATRAGQVFAGQGS